MKKSIIIIIIIISNIVFAEKKLIPINSTNIVENNNKTYIYNLKNKDASIISKSLNIYEGVSINFFENNLIIYGNENKVNELIKLIDKLDTTKNQVYMKVKILDISKDLIYRLGINWTKDSKISLIDYLKKEVNFKLKKMKDSGEIKLKIMPSLLVLDNSVGEIKISNLKLKLNPKIKEKDNLKYIELNIEIYFNDNIIKTTINIDNGKSVFIGGTKNYENSTFSYKSNNKKIRDVYIEVEVVIV